MFEIKDEPEYVIELTNVSNNTIEIDLSENGERTLGFTTGDMSFPFTFENRVILDKFCKEEINFLFEKKLIKIVETKED